MSTTGKQIASPAGFVPTQAITYALTDGTAMVVDAAHPLPIAEAVGAASSTALTGSTAASGSFGPFVPQLGRAIRLTTAGTWSGTVQLLRSIDGGTTRLPLTAGGFAWGSYTANVNEAVAVETEAGATYHVGVTLTGGTLSYRVAQ